MSRMRPRTRATAGDLDAVAQNEIDTTGEDTLAGGGGEQLASVPAPKKLRTTKGNRPKAKKNDSPAESLKLPVELFTEIMLYLIPIDILNFSRTCKAFRTILMRRSSENIWNRAAKNMPYYLPPPPPWLNMPQYVSVVYTNACSGCGGESLPKKPKWHLDFQPVLLVRLCVDCEPNVLIHKADIPNQLRELVKITRGKYSNSARIWYAYACSVTFDKSSVNMRNGNYGLRAEVQKMEKEYNEKRNKIKSDKIFDAWKLSQSRVITEYPEINRWHLIKNVEWSRERQKKAVKDQFRRDVYKRLKDSGWEPDLDYVVGREWNSLTTQSRKLTDRIWSNLFVKLQPILEKARAQRVAVLLVRQKLSLALLAVS